MTQPSPSLLRSLLVIPMLAASALLACSVPVFRYALEHWEADPYQAVVFHRGPLTSGQRVQVQALKPTAGSVETANLGVTTVDVSAEMSPDHAEIWKAQPREAALPRVVLRYPRSTGLRTDLAAMPLEEAAAWRIADSPVRQQILDRLGEGQSAVWVLLESGDKAADDAAEKLLKERLDYLLGVLSLPQLDAQDIANGLVSVGQDDLRLDFSVIRLSRGNQDERALVAMLMGSEEDLHGLASQPMVFPVFGRGRALYALVGKGIAPETIEEAATFLIGKCSCQVKEQNPGIDLLFTADWKKLAQASPLLERELPSLAALAKAAEPVTVTTQPVPAASEKGGGLSWPVIAGVLLLLAMAARLMKK